jgi:hypothetical protein
MVVPIDEIPICPAVLVAADHVGTGQVPFPVLIQIPTAMLPDLIAGGKGMGLSDALDRVAVPILGLIGPHFITSAQEEEKR